MRSILLAGAVVFFHLAAAAQEAISLSYNYGEIAIHTPYIEPLINGPVHGFSMSYAMPNAMGAEWRRHYNFPDYGLTYSYKNYSNPRQLGTSHAISGFLQVPVLRIGKYFDAGFKGLTGLGVFTKKYDVQVNASNRAISSTLNFTVESRLYARVNVHPLFAEYSYGLNHFSNGLIKAPNLGINVFNNAFSLGTYLEEEPAPQDLPAPSPVRKQRYEAWAVSSMGIKELETGSKKYLFSGLTVNFAVFLSQINKLGIGVDVHNDPSLLRYATVREWYPPDAGYYIRYGINLNHEFLLGSTGLFAGYGYYFRDTENNPTRRYFKAGFKYYYNGFIAMALIRAIPLFRAEVVELGIGYRLVKYRK